MLAGTCPPAPTTSTVKFDSSICLFNVANPNQEQPPDQSFGQAIGYVYGVYLNQYLPGFISIAAATAELAVVCKVTQTSTAHLPPLTKEYQVCSARAQGCISKV